MAFCGNCGTQVDGNKFCPSCGKEVAGGQQAQPQQQAYSQPQVPDNDAEANKLMAILSYIFFFIPLLTGDYKRSPFVKYHVNQGTVLFISVVLFGVAYGILTAVLTSIFLFTGAWAFFSILVMLFGILWILPAALVILGIINAATGKTKPLPVIGKFTIIK